MTTPDHSFKPLKLITLPKPTGAKPGNLSDQAFEIHLTIEDAEDQINDLIECIEKPDLNSDGAKQIAYCEGKINCRLVTSALISD